MLENIKETVIERLVSERLNLGHLWALERLTEGKEVSQKFLLAPLTRKEMVLEGLLTTKGIEFLQELGTLQGKRGKRVLSNVSNVADIDTWFDSWWALFPRTDRFNYEGIDFFGGRGLRINKDKCKELFREMVLKNEFTGEQILEATRKDIQARKKASKVEGKNKLTFLNNSVTYLRQQIFSPYVGIEEEGEEERPVTFQI